MRVFDEYVEPAARKLERMIRKQETYKAFSFRASTANAVITSAPLYEVLGAARAAVSRLVEPELTEEGDQEPKIRSEMRKAHLQRPSRFVRSVLHPLIPEVHRGSSSQGRLST